jgi:hypothetical protein
MFSVRVKKISLIVATFMLFAALFVPLGIAGSSPGHTDTSSGGGF